MRLVAAADFSPLSSCMVWSNSGISSRVGGLDAAGFAVGDFCDMLDDIGGGI